MFQKKKLKDGYAKFWKILKGGYTKILNKLNVFNEQNECSKTEKAFQNVKCIFWKGCKKSLKLFSGIISMFNNQNLLVCPMIPR